MQATVYKSTGSWYKVKTIEGNFLNARLKGKFKIKNLTSTNPIAVGDKVILAQDDIEGDTVITEISPRRNYINRVSPHNKNKQHIVAANLDQSLLFATLKDPKTSLGFIDRFLVTGEAYHIPSIIVINKVDLWGEKEKYQIERIKEIYEPLNYKIILMSLQSFEGVETLLKTLANKVSLLSGHSGVGKSTFINYLFPDLNLKTQEVSDWSGKGLHTTTFAEMFDLPQGGQIIDTPGIREMGLVDISKEELSQYFPEMKARMNDCKFNNCQHLEEPGCAIKDAVNSEEISEERYVSYLNIKDSILKKAY